MKAIYHASLFFLLALNSLRADDEGRAADPAGREIILKKIDFNNNTFGEVVIKLNSMIRDSSKTPNAPVIFFNFQGMSESDITKTLNSKILNWHPLTNVPFTDILACLCQFFNCQYQYKQHAFVLTPEPPYKDQTFDVQWFINATRAKHPNE